MYRNCNLNNEYMQNDMMENSNNMYNTFSPENSCMCGFSSSNIFHEPLLYASSYVPHQYMNNVFNPQNGLKIGTIFPELSQGYCPRSIRRNI